MALKIILQINVTKKKQDWKNKFKGSSHVIIVGKIKLFVINLFIFTICKYIWFIDFGASQQFTFYKEIFSIIAKVQWVLMGM